MDPKTGLPNLLQIAVMAQAYRKEIAFGGMPILVQRLLFGVLAPIGRLLGYRASYPYPYQKVQRGTAAAAR